VQLLPDGNLVIFLADHPTTGGYPVIAVVDPAGFTACAQAAPGTTLRFRMRPGPELTRDSHDEGERG
jgi:allophanate hydrolase subunit 2